MDVVNNGWQPIHFNESCSHFSSFNATLCITPKVYRVLLLPKTILEMIFKSSFRV